MQRSIRLRPWQKRALDSLSASVDPGYLAVATPGAGKGHAALDRGGPDGLGGRRHPAPAGRGVRHTTTELFFRQAVGRLVRWRRGTGSDPATMFIPDDPRLRQWAATITDDAPLRLAEDVEDGVLVDLPAPPTPAAGSAQGGDQPRHEHQNALRTSNADRWLQRL